MMRALILVYGKELGTREQVKVCLDQMPEVASWRYELPNCFFILSESSPRELGNAIVERLNVQVPRFIISEVTSDYFGWLVPDTAKFLIQKDVAAKGELGE